MSNLESVWEELRSEHTKEGAVNDGFSLQLLESTPTVRVFAAWYWEHSVAAGCPDRAGGEFYRGTGLRKLREAWLGAFQRYDFAFAAFGERYPRVVTIF